MSRGCSGAAADCVRLQSSDGDTFEVSLKVAKLSRTIETMLRGEYMLHSRSMALVHYQITRSWCHAPYFTSRSGVVLDLYEYVVVFMESLISFLLADLGHEPDDLIPLPKVNTRILKKVCS